MKSFPKWLPWIVIAGILVVLMAMFMSISSTDSRSDDVLERTSKVSDRMWLYVIKSQSESAPTHTLYRHYVASEKSGTENDIIQSLAEVSPFLTGTGTLSGIREEADNQVYITYTGPVVSLSRKASYEYRGEQITVNLNYRLN